MRRLIYVIWKLAMIVGVLFFGFVFYTMLRIPSSAPDIAITELIGAVGLVFCAVELHSCMITAYLYRLITGKSKPEL